MRVAAASMDRRGKHRGVTEAERVSPVGVSDALAKPGE
jgi:hypothetical protein